MVFLKGDGKAIPSMLWWEIRASRRDFLRCSFVTILKKTMKSRCDKPPSFLFILVSNALWQTVDFWDEHMFTQRRVDGGGQQVISRNASVLHDLPLNFLANGYKASSLTVIWDFHVCVFSTCKHAENVRRNRGPWLSWHWEEQWFCGLSLYRTWVSSILWGQMQFKWLLILLGSR